MKNLIKYIGLSLGVAFLSTSCKDFLDKEPSNAVPSESAITSYTDAVTALNGVYQGLKGSSSTDQNALTNVYYYGSRFWYYVDVRSDLMQSRMPASSRTGSSCLMNYTADDSTVPTIWNMPYNVIRRANNLLAALEAGKAVGGTEVDVNNVKGQALTIRALAHFDLARLYCKPYSLVADPTKEYGIPVQTAPATDASKPTRGTLDAVYAQVVKDLTAAVGLMKDTKSNGYFNKWGAQALLSRVYLYMGKNAEALAAAEDVIANSPYKLWTNAEYVNAWSEQATSEAIFEIVMTSTSDWTDREGITYIMQEQGYGEMVLLPKLVNYFASNPNDVRGGVVVAAKKPENIADFGTKKVYCNKLPGRKGASDFRINNLPVLRLSEVYLNAAEAAVKSGDQAKADKYLNAIVKRANPSAATVVATVDNVLDERGYELFGEGHRSFDVLRNGKSIDRTNNYKLDAMQADVKVYDWTFAKAILPIPKSERDANPNIRGEQNPGY